jgi:hypothetical protein
MGLRNRTASGKYVKLKEGKFVFAKDESETKYDELEGTLVDIYMKDEDYNGQVSRKVYIVMNDGEENLIIGFRLDSRYATGFFKFIKNVNLKEPFTLHPVTNKSKDKDGKDRDEYSMIVSQPYQRYVKAYFTKDNPNGLPSMKQVKVSGKTVWDKTDLLEFYEGLVENEIKPKLSKGQSNTTVTEKRTEKFEDVHQDDVDELADLPWENED